MTIWLELHLETLSGGKRPWLVNTVHVQSIRTDASERTLIKMNNDAREWHVLESYDEIHARLKAATK